MTYERFEYIMADNNNVSSTIVNKTLTDHMTTESSIGNQTDLDTWSFEFSVVMATILSISAFLTIVGNIMVLMVIIRHRGMRTRTNLFLVNLAVADLLVGLVVLPFPITTLIEGRWVFGTGAVCSLSGWMNAFCLVTSIHTLMYISIHKFFSIVQPLNNPLNLQRIIFMMAAAWIWGAASATITVSGLEIEYKSGTSQCGPKYPSRPLAFACHAVIQITVIIIPVSTMVYCYIRMFLEIRKHSERLRNNAVVEEDFIIRQQKKVAVTLFIVLTTFVMMVLPYHIYATYTTIKKDKDHFPAYINPLAYMFVYLNSMCNPIIYAFRSPAFREGYKEILCQTPNYVISDACESRRTSRLPSIFGLRRFSRPSVSNTTSLPDNESVHTSPTTPTQKDSNMWLDSKKKSLKSLVRSTRQSRESSVVHRNGEIIIIKGGKIVSVRRESVASPAADTATPLLDMAKCVANSSDNVVCGIALMAGEKDPKEENANGKLPSIHEAAQCDAEGHDSIKIDSDILGSKAFHYDIPGSEDSHSSLDKISQCENREAVSKVREFNIVESHKEQKDGQAIASNTLERPAPGILIQDIDDESQTIVKPKDVTSSTALSKMVHGVASNTDVLLGMPLSPRTKNILAKSDINLSVPPVHNNKSNASVSHAHSTENLNSSHPPLKRLPSLEHLDSPVLLVRSRSSYGIQDAPRQKLSSSRPIPRRLNAGAASNSNECI